MNWNTLCRLARELPEVSEASWYRTPALKVAGKGFVRLKTDDVVVFVLGSLDQQELLLQARPELYFLTDHYRGWPSVLARLSLLDEAEARQRLSESWRQRAPRRLQVAG